MHRTNKIVLTVICAALAGACGTVNSTQTGGATTIPAAIGTTPSTPTTAPLGTSPTERPGAGLALEGHTFVSTSITKAGVATTLAPLAKNTAVATLRFAEGNRISANAGCNGLNGTYTLEGPVLRVSPGESTLIGCDAEVEAQDAWFGGVVASGPTLALAGDTLTLTQGSTVIVFTNQRPDADRPLVGTTWAIETEFRPGGTVGTVVGGKPTVVFADDGTLAFTDSCAGGRARWRQTGDRVTFTDREYNPTVAECPPSDNALEAALHATLAAEGTWTLTIKGSTLELRDGDTGIGLRAES